MSKIYTKGFSFRSDPDYVHKWREYAKAKCMTVDELGTQALNNWLEDHPLDKEEQSIFDARKRKNLD